MIAYVRVGGVAQDRPRGRREVKERRGKKEEEKREVERTKEETRGRGRGEVWKEEKCGKERRKEMTK